MRLEKYNFHHQITSIPSSSYVGYLVTRERFLFMLDAKQRKVAGTVFDRNKRREAEINDALRQEQARHEAAVKNMHRLRALRLQHDKKTKGT